MKALLPGKGDGGFGTTALSLRVTRVLLRILAVWLFLSAILGIGNAIQRLKELKSAVEAYADFDSAFWFVDMVDVFAAGSLVFALLLVPVAIGVWRLLPGAWLAVVCYCLICLGGPLLTYFSWGGGGVRSLSVGYWAEWAFWGGVLGFLVLPGTIAVVGARPVRWATPWLAVILPWIAIVLVVPLSILALKLELAREHGIPFWGGSGVENLGFSRESERPVDWGQAELFNLSFPVPPNVRLARFPVEEDPYSIVVLGSGEPREIILLSKLDGMGHYPSGFMESFGMTDGLDFNRTVLQANWSYWPLVYSGFGLGERERIYWLEEEGRRVLAIQSQASSGERTSLRMYVQRKSGAEIAEVMYALVPADDEDLRVSRIANRLAIRDTVPGERAIDSDNGSVAHDLHLLERYWRGDIEAGMELTERLLAHEEPAIPSISRLIDNLADEVPSHPGLPDLKARLEAVRQ